MTRVRFRAFANEMSREFIEDFHFRILKICNANVDNMSFVDQQHTKEENCANIIAKYKNLWNKNLNLDIIESIHTYIQHQPNNSDISHSQE